MTFARRPRRRLLGLASALAVGALLLSGCGAASTAAPADAEPKTGGDLVFLIDSLGATWIPNNSSISSYQGQIWGNVTDKLIYVDAEGNLSPWIAESWDENADKTQFTLHLKSGVTFSDGTPLDAAAVVANIDIWAKGRPDEGINRIGLFPSANYQGAQAVDATTVTVSFSAPTLSFIPTLAYHGSILLSPETLALPADQQADLTKDVGSGPFVVEKVAEGDSVVLTRRDDYDWGPQAVGHEGAAYLDTITYKQVAEPTLRTASVESGQAQVAYNASPQDLDALKQEGLTVETPRYLGFVNGYALNTSVAPFDDIKVRQAVQHGIDRDEILSTVYTSDWHAAESFFQSTVPEATDHTADFAYDPDEAASLLDGAGWVKGADGVRTKDGKKLSLTLYPNPYLQASQSVDELVDQQLTALGFEVNLETYDVPTYGQKVIGNTTVPATEITRSFVDVGTVAGILTSQKKGDEDWFRLGTSDATLNDLSTRIATATDREARAKVADELQGYVLDRAYFVPLTQIVQRVYVQAPEVSGVTYNGLAYASYLNAWLNG
ncbi:peptide/nickel transport system substrate-binding protein [Microbacterium testaceum StLB037]|uniref:Peptide/nickel transport system substrate-binding protein n=1 Tax=Microbacterium testaceum (strain StLB037) TaxID=979556 RepID=A0A1H0QVY4_MICTS|nr:ABC transporter substrate-binding protein [Microbacterium testaceum]SDP20906.1 peptide/nickel transport system substrate-binding protein [Microbacterium testaceum StLB037]